MAKGLGSSGGSATLQRSKLSNKQELRQSSPKLDDGMGGGGIGKGIFNGGGGGDDGGDDDDYFNEFGGCWARAGRWALGWEMWCLKRINGFARLLENLAAPLLLAMARVPFSRSAHVSPARAAGDGDGDGDGDGFFRKVFKELYDTQAIQAVLQEWYKTMADMPAILRQAATMGLFSSAALVRFLAMDVRPNVTRLVTRSLPPAVSTPAPRQPKCFSPVVPVHACICAASPRG